jgi:hypothetical protein
MLWIIRNGLNGLNGLNGPNGLNRLNGKHDLKGLWCWFTWAVFASKVETCMLPFGWPKPSPTWIRWRILHKFEVKMEWSVSAT